MNGRFARWGDARRTALIGCCWLLLALYFVVPVTTVMEPNLDSSIRATYAHFTAHSYQFGSEVNTTAGPYGFVMYGWDYSGELFWPRFTLIVLFAAGLSALCLWFFWSTTSRWRWPWLGAALLGIEYGDNEFNLALLLGGLFLLIHAGQRAYRVVTVLVLTLLAFLSLMKGTQLATALGIVGTVIGLAIAQRAWRTAGFITVTFCTALMGWWVAAGQNPLHLLTYINRLRHIAQGYNEAMALYESAVVLWIGVALLLLSFLALAVMVFRHWRRPLLVTACLLLAGITWVTWKHGYVRTDGHAYVFFDFSVVLVFSLIVLNRHPWGVPDDRILPRLASGAFAAAVVLLSLSGSETLEPGRFRSLLANVSPRFSRNLSYVFAPEQAHQRAARQLAARENIQTSEFVRKTVGRASVDFYGHQMGVLLLDHLNYQPAPMCCGSYHVYNRYFKELNAAHFLDAQRRPEFMLLKIQSIDQRFVPCDDSLSLLAFLDLYHPVVFEHHALLLQARTDHARPQRPMVILRRRFHFDEEIVVPQVGDDELVLFSVTLPPSVSGRLRSFVYKPPLVSMHLSGEGLRKDPTFRVLPESLAVDALLSPALDDTDDYLALYQEKLPNRVRQLRFTTSGPANFRKSGMFITFSVIRRPTPIPSDAMRRVLLASVYEDPPAVVEPANAMVDDYRNLRVQFLHTPASFTYELRGDERLLTMTIGVDEQAYLAGRTDGVDFYVELLEPGEPPRLLQRRFLQPRDQPSDRGLQTLTAALPPTIAKGAKLRIRSDPGPNHDVGWDWAFATNVKLTRGIYVKEQFPGFKVLPVSCDGGSVSPQTVSSREVVVIAAPGGMSFALNGTERKLDFTGGMLESSYTAGATDGATFVLEYQLPDGTIQSLFSRLLQPRTEVGDRGDQSFSVLLPPAPAGTTLRLRTDPGPAGNNSFDWAYVSALELR
ncbi:MAG: hypothetical protein ABIZ04_05635 [Opitutus sp.]